MSQRYIHNLLLLHFNVGENVALAVNSALRNQLDLLNYCIQRVSRCAPFSDTSTTYRCFFPTQEDHLKYLQSTSLVAICLCFEKTGDDIEITFWNGSTTESFYSRKCPEIEIFVIDHLSWRPKYVSEREFHFEIGNILETFEKLCNNKK